MKLESKITATSRVVLLTMMWDADEVHVPSSMRPSINLSRMYEVGWAPLQGWWMDLAKNIINLVEADR